MLEPSYAMSLLVFVLGTTTVRNAITGLDTTTECKRKNSPPRDSSFSETSYRRALPRPWSLDLQLLASDCCAHTAPRPLRSLSKHDCCVGERRRINANEK